MYFTPLKYSHKFCIISTLLYINCVSIGLFELYNINSVITSVIDNMLSGIFEEHFVLPWRQNLFRRSQLFVHFSQTEILILRERSEKRLHEFRMFTSKFHKAVTQFILVSVATLLRWTCAMATLASPCRHLSLTAHLLQSFKLLWPTDLTCYGQGIN